MAAGLGADLLYELYQEVWDGGDIPRDFVESLLVFLHKWDFPGEGKRVARQASSTRPLNLNNTDCKCVTMAFAKGLNEAAKTTVDPEQRGCVKGRSMADNILKLEGKALVHDATNGLDNGVLLTDFAAAYPPCCTPGSSWC